LNSSQTGLAFNSGVIALQTTRYNYLADQRDVGMYIEMLSIGCQPPHWQKGQASNIKPPP
jgi:hypothetical protein